MSNTSYELAEEQYAAFGIDTDAAIEKALSIPISLHCWQADDNLGFEPMDEVSSGGGILVTGNHPGRARTAEETRAHPGPFNKSVLFAALPDTQPRVEVVFYR